MNNIKRKKEGKDILLSYRFGIYEENNICKKIVLFSKLNKRIFYCENMLERCLFRRYSEEAIVYLIENGIQITDNCLHLALDNNYSEKFIKFLIFKNTTWNLDTYRNTPLHIALDKKYSDEIIKLLISDAKYSGLIVTEYGKGLKKICVVGNLDFPNDTGKTPLVIALKNKYSEEIVRLLITENNICKLDEDKKFPLIIALENNYSEEILKELFKEGGIKYDCVDSYKFSELITRKNLSKEVSELLKKMIIFRYY